MIITIATQVLVGIAIAGTSAWITVLLSFGKFRREKWWERKAAAYERIIEALHVCKAYAEEYLTAIEESRDLPKERLETLMDKVGEAHSELTKAIDIGAFILSDAAHDRLLRYRTESEEARSDDLHAYVEDDLAATDKCLVDIIAMAKKDLRTR